MTWGGNQEARPAGSRADRVRSALQTISTDVDRGRRTFGARPAWGQFLDVPVNDGQVGIYGTSSAIQILMDQPIGGTSAADALPTLPGTESTDPSASFDDDDLVLTLKCCSIIEARASAGSAAGLIPAERVILDSVISSGDLSLAVPESLAGQYAGWGFATKYADVDYANVRPDVLSTAHVILALRSASIGSRLLASEQDAVDRTLSYAMRWAADEVMGKPDTSPVEWALTFLAAKTFLGAPSTLGVPADKLVRRLRRTLKDRLRGTRITELPRSEPRFYAVPRHGGRSDNHYVTFPVHFIVSWALTVAVPRRLPLQRQIFDVCDQLSKAVNSSGAPVSMATGRKSITD